MLRIIHTADWHLGHQLHGQNRDYEHQQFLDWLLQQCIQQQLTQLIVAGDIFDSANPPSSAVKMLYKFITAMRTSLPACQLIFIAGNHDSAQRLNAITPLLEALNVVMVGNLSYFDSGEPDWRAITIALHNEQNQIEGWCGAMPFLRGSDIPLIESEQESDPLIAGVTLRYQQLQQYLQQRHQPQQAQIVTGHCYLSATKISELSERKILGGNQHALPWQMFTESTDYVALGHLHLAQSVGKEHIRYSGSPLPLSTAELHYKHQLQLLQWHDGTLTQQSLYPPRSVALIRIPDQGYAPLQQIAVLLKELPTESDLPTEQWPLIEVAVQLNEPNPALRQQIEELIQPKALRLVKISLQSNRNSQSLADTLPNQDLHSLDPQQVFIRCYQRHYSDEPAAALQQAFSELLEQAQHHEVGR